jgi:tRNA threonylcarbamoyladenosine biosynthesis protein TsaE
LKYEQEAIQAGVEDCLYNDHICLVEWPEKITSLLPENTLHVFIEPVNDQTRKLRIEDN